MNCYSFRTEMIKTHLTEEETLFLQSRQESHNYRAEINTLKKAMKELQDAKQLDQQRIEEIQQKSTDLERSLQAAQKRNQELQERCDELSKQCELERKQR